MISADLADVTFDNAVYVVSGQKTDGSIIIWDGTLGGGWCGTADEGVNQYCPDMFDNGVIEWTSLLSVSIEAHNGAGSIDNIVISQVPVPAALWLFGSALAGLGWLRRKQTI
jgi:hypothetical protein